MENRINSVLELANGEKYVVVNQAIYQGKNFFLLAKVTDDEEDLAGDLKIVEEVMQDGVLGVRIVKDEKLLQLLIKYLEPEE